jgi:short-subunit dehydrogenase
MLGPLEDLGDDRLRAQFETNVFGLMSVTRAFLPQMRERGFGRIVNVSSMGGRMTFPLMGAYNATKYAVESLSDALRNEVHAFGIGVSLVEPGYIRTEFADVAMSKIEVTPGSAFAPLMNKAGEVLEMFEKTGVGPEHVSRAIRKAIESKRPSARYVAPWRTYMALWLITMLPTSWVDAAFRTAMGLTKRNLAKQLPPKATETKTQAVAV